MNKEKFLQFVEKRHKQKINLGKEVAVITIDNKPLFEIMLQGKFLRLTQMGQILFTRTINTHYLDRHLQLFFEMTQEWQSHIKRFGESKLISHHNVPSSWGTRIKSKFEV